MKTTFAAVLVLLAIASAQAQDVTPVRKLLQTSEPKFPYCRCSDYSCESSPYTISLTRSSILPGNIGEFTFTLGLKPASADPGTPCWDKMLASLYKVMFYANVNCVDEFNAAGKYVAVNGVRKGSSVWFETYSTGGLLKLSGMNLNSTTAPGTTITVRAAAGCNTPATFFNQTRGQGIEVVFSESSVNSCCPRNCTTVVHSPPSPIEERPEFYPHTCAPGNPAQWAKGGLGLGLAGTPYEIEWVPSGVAHRYCFNAIKKGCDERLAALGPEYTKCCETGLDKVEFVMRSAECRASVRDVKINEGRGMSPSYDMNWDKYPVVKFTGLGFAYEGYTTQMICFSLDQRPTSPCKTLESLFEATDDGTDARYATFNQGHTCCGWSTHFP